MRPGPLLIKPFSLLLVWNIRKGVIANPQVFSHGLAFDLPFFAPENWPRRRAYLGCLSPRRMEISDNYD